MVRYTVRTATCHFWCVVLTCGPAMCFACDSCDSRTELSEVCLERTCAQTHSRPPIVQSWKATKPQEKPSDGP